MISIAMNREIKYRFYLFLQRKRQLHIFWMMGMSKSHFILLLVLITFEKPLLILVPLPYIKVQFTPRHHECRRYNQVYAILICSHLIGIWIVQIMHHTAWSLPIGMNQCMWTRSIIMNNNEMEWFLLWFIPGFRSSTINTSNFDSIFIITS
jgi:hypothetical protein